jgi:hypothetical protein
MSNELSARNGLWQRADETRASREGRGKYHAPGAGSMRPRPLVGRLGQCRASGVAVFSKEIA